MIIEENILCFIPQRPPFVMIDELIYSGQMTTRTSFVIAEDNIFVEAGEFLEAGLIENMAQTAAAGKGHTSRMENKPAPVGYISVIKNLEIFALPKINDELITEIIIENQVFDFTTIAGKIWCNKTLMARCEMRIFIS